MSGYVYSLVNDEGEPVFTTTRKYEMVSYLLDPGVDLNSISAYRSREGRPDTTVNIGITDIVRQDAGEL
jgi:hypothetical protein